MLDWGNLQIYEYTTQIAVTSDLNYESAKNGVVPVQVIFALKEQNQKKINSHRWFFNAFARSLNPNVCILLDVGTRPGMTSIYHLWKTFDKDSKVGGAVSDWESRNQTQRLTSGWLLSVSSI